MKTLILADVHANLASLEAVLDHEKTWDEVLFLGDAVMGGPQPNETLSLLRSLDGIFLMGNHDLQALNMDLDGEGTDPHQVWCRWIGRTLTPKNRRFLANLSGPRSIVRQGLRLRLIHGQLPEHAGGKRHDRYLWPDAPAEQLEAMTDRYPEPIILHGHCHIQYRRQVDGVEFINPGGLGQPRLGRPLACYAVLADGRINLRAVPYDVAKTCRAMAQMDLDAEFIAMWQKIYRQARLAKRYRSRDLGPFMDGPYR